MLCLRERDAFDGSRQFDTASPLIDAKCRGFAVTQGKPLTSAAAAMIKSMIKSLASTVMARRCPSSHSAAAPFEYCEAHAHQFRSLAALLELL
jgi:hypothetical protein